MLTFMLPSWHEIQSKISCIFEVIWCAHCLFAEKCGILTNFVICFDGFECCFINVFKGHVVYDSLRGYLRSTDFVQIEGDRNDACSKSAQWMRKTGIANDVAFWFIAFSDILSQKRISVMRKHCNKDKCFYVWFMRSVLCVRYKFMMISNYADNKELVLIWEMLQWLFIWIPICSGMCEGC